MQLSTGPWSYNRFNAYEQLLAEGAKPDFLDMDKDGDKKEPMKKAIKEKGSKKECDDCGNEDCDCDKKKSIKEGKGPAPMPMTTTTFTNKTPAIKTAPKSEKSPAPMPRTQSTTSSSTKLNVKEALINSIMDDGLANNPVSAEIIVEHMSDEWAQAILDELA